MYTPPISSYPQMGVAPTMQPSPQKPGAGQEVYGGTVQMQRPPQVAAHKLEENKGMYNPSTQPGMKPQQEALRPAGGLTTVPLQIAKDFLAIVKKGNMAEIINFISK